MRDSRLILAARCARVALALVGVAAQCSVGQRPKSAMMRAGYLVIGKIGAREFGLLAGDTLPEVATADVPQVVSDSVASAAKTIRIFTIDARCTRFFRAELLYVAFVQADCGPRTDDGEALIGIWISTHRTNVVPVVGADVYDALVPDVRK